jgi:hypothetical protein
MMNIIDTSWLLPSDVQMREIIVLLSGKQNLQNDDDASFLHENNAIKRRNRTASFAYRVDHIM